VTSSVQNADTRASYRMGVAESVAVISLCLVIRVEAEITKRCSVCGGLFSLVGRNWYVVSGNRFGLGDR
jgi:hypothetical protein